MKSCVRQTRVYIIFLMSHFVMIPAPTHIQIEIIDYFIEYDHSRYNHFFNN